MSFAKYVEQLIEELNNAKTRVPEVPKCLYEEPMPGLWYIAEWENAPFKKLSEWFGIPKDVFPSPDSLSENEIERLVQAMIDLWAVFNFYPDLPENLPAPWVYKILSENWDREIQYTSANQTGMDFCECDPERCVFPIEYCDMKDKCLKSPDDMDAMVSDDDNNET
jgi:hypothetical protein